MKKSWGQNLLNAKISVTKIPFQRTFASYKLKSKIVYFDYTFTNQYVSAGIFCKIFGTLFFNESKTCLHE